MKKLGIILAVVLLVGLLVWVFACPHGPAQDEAMQAGLTPEDFAQAPDEPDFLAEVDGGIELSRDAVLGRNTWWLWTGGNQAFWDYLANNSFGTFDLLKTMSSYPCSPEQEQRAREYEARLAAGEGGYAQGIHGDDGYGAPPGHDYGGYGETPLYAQYACGDTMYPEPGQASYRYYSRDARFCYTGLINEPGFRQATQPDEYGLCLDEQVGDGMPGFTEEHEKIYGRSTGVLGLRLFPNPSFDEEAEQRWKEAMERDAFYTDPSFYADRDLVRPYRVGMSCGFCHISHHPNHPPEDPESPEWANLSGTIGAQYFWFGRVFGPNVTPDNFVWYLLDAQRPGAVDTSLVPSDNLLNPRAMNAVFEVKPRLAIAEKIGIETSAGGALDLPEVQERGPTFGVPHILWDGADSVGIDAALTRVYINIGEYHQQWIRTIDVMVGLRKQSPITVEAAQENSVFWNATQERADEMAAYLIEAGYRYPLAATEGYGEAAPTDEPSGEGEVAASPPPMPGGTDDTGATGETAEASSGLDRGRVVFAETCARCHSSKLPEPVQHLSEEGCIGENYLQCFQSYWEWTESEEFKQRMTEIVRQPDFLEQNFLSNDMRVPVHQPLVDFEPQGIDPSASTLEQYLEARRQRALATGALETEICSAMASNALESHVWDNFSSASYKSLPSVGTVELYNPITDEVKEWETPGGGRGYQRVPSLVAIWSTAPLLHNNEIGEFTGDPSVEGRLAAFDDAIRKLLWPERRPHTVHRTQTVTDLAVNLEALPRLQRIGAWFLSDDGQVRIGPIPAGTPVSLLANADLARDVHDHGWWDLIGLVRKAGKDLKRISKENLDDEQATEVLRGLVPDFLDLSACPDFIVDRGHYYGTDLSDEDKEALIEYLKTL